MSVYFKFQIPADSAWVYFHACTSIKKNLATAPLKFSRFLKH